MDDIAIKVDNVSKAFKLPHEKQSSVKSAFINFYRRGKNYELQKALMDISFEIKKGEFFGIVGRNGSGKSTLLKLLAGIYSPSTGSINIDGTLTPFIELGVGFNPELTGRENVFLNGALLGFNRKEIGSMYADIVKFAELERFMDQKLKNYSSGMQVRLAFSIAIRAQSSILLIDEVLAVGDAAFQKKCLDIFKDIKKSGRTVVFVSHDMATVRKFCDRALLINNGKTVDIGDPYEISSKYTALNQPVIQDEKNKGAKIIKTQVVSGSVHNDDQTIEIELSYQVSKDEKIVAGLSILREDNTYIAGFNNLYEQTANSKGKQKIVCRIGKNQLLNGGYFINSSLYTEDFQLLDHATGSAFFSVKGKEDESRDGSFKIKCDWESK